MANKEELWPGWETVRVIGRGGFGCVYEIRRTVRGRTEHAALKVLSIPKDEEELRELRSDGYDNESMTLYFSEGREKIEDEYANVVYCDDIRSGKQSKGFC